jgi:hypothetical protein
MIVTDIGEIKRLERRVRHGKWLKTKAGLNYAMRHRAVLVHTVVGLLRKPDGRQWRMVRTVRVTV